VISGGKKNFLDRSPVLSRETISGSMDSLNMKPWSKDTASAVVAEEQVRCQIATEEVAVQCGDMVRITLLNEAECDTVLAAEIEAQSDFHFPASAESLIGQDGILNAPIADDFNPVFRDQNREREQRNGKNEEQRNEEHINRPWAWSEETW
jgi:hypothetical protein